MSANTPIYQINIVVIGSRWCGKSSLCTAYTEKPFQEYPKATVIMDIVPKTLTWEEKTGELKIRDTGGEERFKAVTPNFYRNAHAVILCYDITRKETFDSIPSWCECKAIPEEAILFLVGCKSDLTKERTVSASMGPETANTLSNKQSEVKFFETSAKTKQNIEELFDSVISSVMEKWGLDLIIKKKDSVKVNNSEDDKKLCWPCSRK